MSDVFISYSRKDGAFALALAEALRESGLDVWIDLTGIAPTAEWLAEIFAGIEAADNFLVLLSPAWIESETCRIELRHAADRGKRIVPLLLAKPSEAPPEPLARLQWVSFGPGGGPGDAAEAALRAIRTDLDHVRTHTRLLQRALEWRAAGEGGSKLLRGQELAAAEAWCAAATADPPPTGLQRSYLAAGRAAARRRRRLYAAFGALALAASSAGFFVFLGEAERAAAQERTALSRKLASEALLEISGAHDLPLLLALEAHRIEPTIESLDAVLRGLQARPNLLRMLPLESRRATGLRFSEDGARLAVAAADGSVLDWSLEDGSARQAAAGFGREVDHVVIAADFSPSLASGSGELFARPGSAAPPDAAKDYNVIELAVSPDGLSFASGNGLRGAGASLWDAETFEEIRRLRTPDGFGVDAVAFSPDGARVAAAGWDRRIAVFDVATGELAHVIDTGADGFIDAVAFSPDGALLAYAHSDTIFAVAPEAPEAGPRFTAPAAGSARRILFSPDGRRLAAAFDEGRVRVWDLAGAEPPLLLADLESYLEVLAFSPDSRFLAGGGYHPAVAVWDLSTIRQIGDERARHGDRVSALAVAPDGATGATGASGGRDRILRLWPSEGDGPGFALPGHQSDIFGLAFEGDGATLLSLGAPGGPRLFEPPEIVRWRARGAPAPLTALPPPPPETGLFGLLRQIERMQGGRLPAGPGSSALDSVLPVALSAGAVARVRAVSEGGDALVEISPLAAGGAPVTIPISHRGGIAALALSPASLSLASAGLDGSVEVRDLAAPGPARLVEGAGRCASLGFDRTGERLVAACGAEALMLTRPFAESEPVRFVRDGAPLSAALVSPDGARLVTFDERGAMAIHDVASRRAFGGEVSLGGALGAAAFGPDGRFLYTGDEAGRVIRWDLSFEAWRAAACRIAGRNLTAAEWTRFLGDAPYRETCPQIATAAPRP